MLDCRRIVADGHQFDLSKLEGAHSVITSQRLDGRLHNTTYTTDICRPLKRKGDVKLEDQCPSGTRVCAIEHLITPESAPIEAVWPIAGELKGKDGGHLNHEVKRLKSSDSNTDSKKEGLRLIMNGGVRSQQGDKRPQRVIIEFLCDPDREGTEGEAKPGEEYDDGKGPIERRGEFDPLLYAAEDGDDGDEDKPKGPIQLGGANASLIFDSYGKLDSDHDMDVLRMTWKTKYACEKRADDGDSSSGGSSFFRFFTWLVVIVFMGTAAYLIFGSWLNYNRYGARGWDLLPHGDTIRDIPYLLKEWTRNVLNTVQGSGSRGGYSAV